MACNRRCDYCNKNIRVTSITNVPGVAIILNIPQINLQNLKKYCIDLNVLIPAPIGGTDPLIFISNGLITVPVLNCAGNFARVSQLDCSNKTECGLRFSAIYGSDAPHFLFKNGLDVENCCNQFGLVSQVTGIGDITAIAALIESLQPDVVDATIAGILNPVAGGVN